MRACYALLILSAATRGLAAKARPDSPSAGLLQLPALYGRNKGAPRLPAENQGLTRAVLSCRGGSVTAPAGTPAGAPAATSACRGDGRVRRGFFHAVADKDTRRGAKHGWGQLRRSPEARTSSSTELLGPRGGCVFIVCAPVPFCRWLRLALCPGAQMVNDC